MARRLKGSRRPSGAAPTRPTGAAAPAPWTTARFARWLAAIGLGALALRLVYLFELRGTPLFAVLLGDARVYDAWGTRIAAGDWIGTDVFYQSPLYPYFLAVVFKILGHHLFVVRVVQAAMGATSCLLLALAGRRFFGAGVGLIAGALLAVYPTAIFFDGLIQKSSLDLLLVTMLLACLGEFRHRPDRRWLVAIGVATGAFILNRENARVVYPILIAWLWMVFRATPWRARAVWSAVLTAAMAAVLLPVGWRNYHVGGEFLVSTSQLGPNFYIGNHAGAPGIYDPLLPDRGDPAVERADATRLAEEARGRRLSPGEVSDYWLGRGLAWARSEPTAWLGLMGRKLMFTIGAAEITDTESVEAYADSALVLRILRGFSFGVILPLGIFGAWQTRAAWRELTVLYLLFAGLVVSIVIFYSMARYRYPLVPVVLLFGAAAVSDLAALRRESARSRWVAAALAVVVAVPCNLPGRQPDDVTYANLGAELIAANRPADAVLALEKAVRVAPGYAPGHLSLGLALTQTGEKSRARDQFSAAVNLRPDYAEAQSALGSALLDVGNLSEALDHFEAAARLKPDAADVQCDLGQALLQAGQGPQAAEHLQAALRINPDYARAHNAMAGVLQQSGHPVEALAHLEEAVRLEPDNLGMQMNLANLLAGTGRAKDAIGHYEQALTIAQASGRTDLVQGIATAIRALAGRIGK